MEHGASTVQVTTSYHCVLWQFLGKACPACWLPFQYRILQQKVRTERLLGHAKPNQTKPTYRSRLTNWPTNQHHSPIVTSRSKPSNRPQKQRKSAKKETTTGDADKVPLATNSGRSSRTKQSQKQKRTRDQTNGAHHHTHHHCHRLGYLAPYRRLLGVFVDGWMYVSGKEETFRTITSRGI